MVLDLGDDCLLLRAQLHDARGFQRDLIVMAGVVEGLQTQAAKSAPGQLTILALQARPKPHANPLVCLCTWDREQGTPAAGGKVEASNSVLYLIIQSTMIGLVQCTGWQAARAGRSANRVGALVLQIGLGQHDDSALLHDGLKLVHALVEGAAADFAALRVQQLKGEQLACTGNRSAVPASPAQG